MKIKFGKLLTNSGTIEVNFGDGVFHSYDVESVKEDGIQIPDSCTDYSLIQIKGNSTILSNLDVVTGIKTSRDGATEIRFKGPYNFNNLPSLDSVSEGDICRVTDDTYTDNTFIEGAGKPINAGDNIVAVEVDSGLVDVKPYFNAYGDTWTVEGYNLYKNNTVVANIDSGNAFTDGVSPYYFYQDLNYDYEACIKKIEEDGTETILDSGYSLNDGYITDNYIYINDNNSLKRSPKDNISWESIGHYFNYWDGKHGDTIFYWDENADESTLYYFMESDPSISGSIYGSFGDVQAYFAGENVLVSLRNEYYIFNFNTHQFDPLSDTSAYNFDRLRNVVYLKGVSYVLENNKLYKTTDGITWTFVKDLPVEITSLNYTFAQRYLKLFGQNENNNYYDVLEEPRKALKWNKLAAGINYENFVAENISASSIKKNDSEVLTMSDKGASNGVATLDSTGRIPYSQLPESAMEYKGSWDASTNMPTLVDGTGDNGDFYIVSAEGTATFADGRSVKFNVNDKVIYDSAIQQWSRLPAGEVRSVNGKTGDVEIKVPNVLQELNSASSDPISSRAVYNYLGTENSIHFSLIKTTLKPTRYSAWFQTIGGDFDYAENSNSSAKVSMLSYLNRRFTDRTISISKPTGWLPIEAITSNGVALGISITNNTNHSLYFGIKDNVMGVYPICGLTHISFIA